ncbi:MAG: FAD:protein FMN transferase [Firmicutes bacterium]|nr:FAD:protein FMN transferase [candidate division NPL-UPA2 bacterium]
MPHQNYPLRTLVTELAGKMKYKAVVLTAAVVLLLVAAWVGQESVVVRRAERQVLLMDTFVRLVVHGRLSQAALEETIEATVKEMARLESILSAHATGSDIDKLNNADTEPRVVSDETFAVLERAKLVYERSQGAFDVTVGALMRAWGFGTDQRAVPSPEALTAALSGVGFAYVEMDASQRTVRLTHPKTRLDLGGIAKGYIVDRAIELLAARGIQYAFVEAGGPVRVGEASGCADRCTAPHTAGCPNCGGLHPWRSCADLGRL